MFLPLPSGEGRGEGESQRALNATSYCQPLYGNVSFAVADFSGQTAT
jgi:hypothetical protein